MIIAWTGAHCIFAVEKFFEIGDICNCYRELFLLFLCYERMMLFWIENGQEILLYVNMLTHRTFTYIYIYILIK